MLLPTNLARCALATVLEMWSKMSKAAVKCSSSGHLICRLSCGYPRGVRYPPLGVFKIWGTHKGNGLQNKINDAIFRWFCRWHCMHHTQSINYRLGDVVQLWLETRKIAYTSSVNLQYISGCAHHGTRWRQFWMHHCRILQWYLLCKNKNFCRTALLKTRFFSVFTNDNLHRTVWTCHGWKNATRCFTGISKGDSQFRLSFLLDVRKVKLWLGDLKRAMMWMYH